MTRHSFRTATDLKAFQASRLRVCKASILTRIGYVGVERSNVLGENYAAQLYTRLL